MISAMRLKADHCDTSLTYQDLSSCSEPHCKHETCMQGEFKDEFVTSGGVPLVEVIVPLLDLILSFFAYLGSISNP